MLLRVASKVQKGIVGRQVLCYVLCGVRVDVSERLLVGLRNWWMAVPVGRQPKAVTV